MRKVLQCLSACALLFVLCALSGCKATDFFTEIVITPTSEVEAQDTEQVTHVNTPDAEVENSMLVALDWSTEAEPSVTVQSLVVYSATPTSELEARHSIYDVDARFAGIEASDAVNFVFDATSELTFETSDGEASGLEGSAASDATAEPAQSEAEPEAGEGEASDEAADSADSSLEGANDGGDADTSGQADSDAETDGNTELEDSGYGAEVSEYNPDDAFAEVQHADAVAVLGTNAAVMVQMLGGKGAICAMSEYAYEGKTSAGKAGTTASSFAETFSEQLTSGFAASALLWEEDGSSPSNLTDVDALVEACGEGGVIVYEQTLGSQETLFNKKQRQKLAAANIQLVPVSFATVTGITDAAAAIGEALSESAACEKDAAAMAKSYTKAIKAIVKATVATHGTTLASGQLYGRSSILTTYTSAPVKSVQPATTYTYIATTADTGVKFTNDYGVDASSVLLFSTDDYESTPLLYWCQVAGVWNGAYQGAVTGTQMLWPLYRVLPSTSSISGGTSGATTSWLGAKKKLDAAISSSGTTDYVLVNTMRYATTVTASANESQVDGVGTSSVPYLIVSGTSSLSAADVKARVVSSMTSYLSDGSVTPYSILPQNLSVLGGSNMAGLTTMGATVRGVNNSTTWLGCAFVSEADGGDAEVALSAEDVVRENPAGLLGAWTEGNAESVLEAVWLAEIYSAAAEGSDYEPVTDMSSFSVTIGEGLDEQTTCTSFKELVLAFYETYYGVSLSSATYAKVVTDE